MREDCTHLFLGSTPACGRAGGQSCFFNEVGNYLASREGFFYIGFQSWMCQCCGETKMGMDMCCSYSATEHFGGHLTVRK